MYKTIKVELSYGCNLRCSFCGIQSTPDLKPHFMTMETFEHVLKRVGEDPRKLTISFSLRGEPTLNPDYLEFVQRASFVAHKIIMVTNGTQLTCQKVNELFVAGLDALHIDVYNDRGERLIKDVILNGDRSLYDVALYGVKKIWTHKGLVSICDERKTRQNNTRALHNWAGANKSNQAFLETIPRSSPCAEPLKMITIRHDGTYALCCHTWNDIGTFGNVSEFSFQEHYNGLLYKQIAREIMTEYGRENVKSCQYCNVKSSFAHMFRRAVK